MSNPGPIRQNRELLSDLKQDESNSYRSDESQATKEHVAGATGKLASAISQHQGEQDLSKGGQGIARKVDPSGGEVTRDAVQESLRARADAKTKQEFGENPERIARGSETSRLQSAADQYDLAREGKQSKQTKTM